MNKKYRLISLLAVVLALAGLIAWYFHHTTVAVLEPAGPVARQERSLIFTGLLLSLIVVIPVFGLLFGFAWRYREGNTKANYSPKLAGSRLAETVWWLVPSLLILVISVLDWHSSHALDPYRPLEAKTKPITVQVIALDWKWLFIYPQQNIASVNFVQFPAGTPVNFQITADAPMNSFWIPRLGGQIYAMPGMSTQLNLLADHNGKFYGSSANISGNGFAGMHFIAKASSQADFNNWVNVIKHTSSPLNLNTYGLLAKPSTNSPVSYYSSVEGGLYDEVVMKFMMPLQGTAP
ncbi:MAG TPA: ubiquinol oxidase subunit II [Candidatus Saccharimonadales bacterium]